MDGSGTADRVDRAAVSTGDSAAGATHTREVDPLTVTQRLQREGRWADIEPERSEMMRIARKQGMSKLDAQLLGLRRAGPALPSAGGPSPGTLPGEGEMHFSGDPADNLHDGRGERTTPARFRAVRPARRHGRSFRRMPPSPRKWAGFRRTGFGSWTEIQAGGATSVDLGTLLFACSLMGCTRLARDLDQVVCQVSWTWQPRPQPSHDGEADVVRRERMAH